MLYADLYVDKIDLAPYLTPEDCRGAGAPNCAQLAAWLKAGSFYLEDLDHNWWEIQCYDGFQHDDMFDFGDRFSMDEDSDIHNLKELEIQTSK